MPTLKEIAQACGVSYGTVSRAFNPNASVKPEVRARILKYAQSVNYTPDLMAQSLKKRRTGIIGVILPTPQNSFSEVLFEFNMNLLRSCEIALKQRGYRLIVSFASTPEEELTALQQSSGIHVEGVLLQPIDHSNEAMIRSMQSTTAFIQCNGPFYSDMDRIYPEDYGGTFTAVNYLLQRGHRRILCICGDVRSRYFAQALAERGLTADPLQILSSNADEAEITKRLLEYRPTAVFAVAEECFPAYSAILSLGWRVPEQISFLAYNDATWMRLLGVSAIAHRFDAFGEMIANRFAYCIEQYADSRGFPEATRSTLDMKLVERRSVRNLADTAAVYPD